MRKSKILIPLMSTVAIGSSLVATVSCGGQNDPDDPIPVTYKVAFDESASKGVEKPELPETIEEKKALDVTFKLKEGYTILTKEGIKVTIGGSSYTDFAFDKSSLKLSIPEGAITADVVISAKAAEKALGDIYAEYDQSQPGIKILQDTDKYYEEFLVEGSKVKFWLEDTEQAKDKVIYLPLDDYYEVEKDAVYIMIDGVNKYNLTCNVDYKYEITKDSFTCILTKAGALRIKNVVSQAKENAHIYVKFDVGAGNINVKFYNTGIGDDLPYKTLIYVGTSDTPTGEDTISLIDAYQKGFKVRYQAPSLLFNTFTHLNFDLSVDEHPTVSMGDPWGDDVQGFTTDFGTYEDGEYEGINYIEFKFQPETVWNDIYPWVVYYEQNSEFTFVPNNADGSVATKTPTIDKAEALDILFDDGQFVITMDADEQTSCKYEDDCITEISVGTWTIPNDGTYYSYDVDSDSEGTKINLTFTEEAYTEFAGKFSSSVNISVKAVWRS